MLSMFILLGCSSKIQVFEGFNDVEIIWGDYEKATYDLLINGEKSAQYESIIVKSIEDNQELYKIDASISSKEGMGMTGAVVDTYLNPIFSYNKQILWGENSNKSLEVFGSYNEEALNIEEVFDDRERLISLSVPNHIIDNEYSLMLARNLPLSEGYNRKLNIAVISTAQIAPYNIRVAGIEKVTVPYGEIECYKVVWEYIGKGRAENIYSWYSTDKDKKMVKYKNQDVEFQLIDFETGEN